MHCEDISSLNPPVMNGRPSLRRQKIIDGSDFSQADLHAVYGGVVPEIASRRHVESISILAQKAIEAAGITRQDTDAVAVSYA